MIILSLNFFFRSGKILPDKELIATVVYDKYRLRYTICGILRFDKSFFIARMRSGNGENFLQPSEISKCIGVERNSTP